MCTTYDPIKRNNNDTNNVERRVDSSYDNDNNNNNNIVSPDWKQHASMKQTIPCSVQNEENSSVVSHEKQHGSFTTDNDIDFDDDYIDWEDDYIDLAEDDNNNNSNIVSRQKQLSREKQQQKNNNESYFDFGIEFDWWYE